MVGWDMRSFRTRGSYILMTILKSLVQPHLDYCCQLWCPSTQYQINRIYPLMTVDELILSQGAPILIPNNSNGQIMTDFKGI